MTIKAKDTTVELINVLRLNINALSTEFKNKNDYLTDEEKVDLFLFLETQEISELWLLYRLSDYTQLIQIILQNRSRSTVREEEE